MRNSTSKGVIRSRVLTLTPEEETALALGKPGVTNIRIPIRNGEEQIQTNTYILTFNLKEMKIGYCLES